MKPAQECNEFITYLYQAVLLIVQPQIVIIQILRLGTLLLSKLTIADMIFIYFYALNDLNHLNHK